MVSCIVHDKLARFSVRQETDWASNHTLNKPLWDRPRKPLGCKGDPSPTSDSFAEDSGQNVRMTKLTPITVLALAMTLAQPVRAAEKYVPWPSKQQLRKLQITAFSCSRENQEEPCLSTRNQANVLMDHPRLPAICKDVLWSLIESAKVADRNDYKRRDVIDKPAKQLAITCAEPIKKKEAPKPGALKPNSGFGFGTSS